MAGIEETLLNEYDSIFYILLGKVDDYNKAKSEYTEVNNKLKSFRDELEFVTREHDIAVNEELGERQIVNFEARMEELLEAIQETKRKLLPKLKAVEEAHEELKHADNAFNQADVKVLAKHKDFRLLKNASEMRFENNSRYENPDKSVHSMMMRDESYSSLPQQNQSNLSGQVKSLEAKTREEMTNFTNARNEESRRYFYLRSVWAELKFLREALTKAQHHEKGERYIAVMKLVDGLKLLEKKYLEELSKWGELKQASEQKFEELRKQFYKASGNFIDTPATEERVLEQIRLEPKVRQIIKDVVGGFLADPEAAVGNGESTADSVIEVSSIESLNENLPLDELVNIPLPSSTEESISDENSSLSLASKPNQTTSNFNETFNEAQNTIVLDEAFVKDELAFYDGWLNKCNTDIQRILERQKKLKRNQREANATLSAIKTELSKAEQEFKMSSENFEESLTIVIDIAKNILSHEEKYSASLVGIAKLWLKRLEPQVKKAKEFNENVDWN